MPKFRKKAVVIEATQWFKNGDHPEDNCKWLTPSTPGAEPFLSEGKVVRYFRRPDVSGKYACNHCGGDMHVHGWIDGHRNGGASYIVCPGDWIITGVNGEYYPCKPDIFSATYEPADIRPSDAGVGGFLTLLHARAHIASSALADVNGGDWAARELLKSALLSYWSFK